MVLYESNGIEPLKSLIIYLRVHRKENSQIRGSDFDQLKVKSCRTFFREILQRAVHRPQIESDDHHHSSFEHDVGNANQIDYCRSEFDPLCDGLSIEVQCCSLPNVPQYLQKLGNTIARCSIRPTKTQAGTKKGGHRTGNGIIISQKKLSIGRLLKKCEFVYDFIFEICSSEYLVSLVFHLAKILKFLCQFSESTQKCNYFGSVLKFVANELMLKWPHRTQCKAWKVLFNGIWALPQFINDWRSMESSWRTSTNCLITKSKTARNWCIFAAQIWIWCANLLTSIEILDFLTKVGRFDRRKINIFFQKHRIIAFVFFVCWVISSLMRHRSMSVQANWITCLTFSNGDIQNTPRPSWQILFLMHFSNFMRNVGREFLICSDLLSNELFNYPQQMTFIFYILSHWVSETLGYELGFGFVWNIEIAEVLAIEKKAGETIPSN